jgi:hypothetical protein
VPLVSVVLDGIGHMCCGPRRQLGDTVTMQIHNYQGQVYEERHPGGVSIVTQPVTGTIVQIAWRAALMRDEVGTDGSTVRMLDGYGPAVPIGSTEYGDPQVAYWAFEFTVDTDDPVPEPREE